jgi:hypothetical protein
MATITRLERRTIQVSEGEGEELRGVFLYFETESQADRIETRLKWTNDPMSLAEELWKAQQEGAA